MSQKQGQIKKKKRDGEGKRWNAKMQEKPRKYHLKNHAGTNQLRLNLSSFAVSAIKAEIRSILDKEVSEQKGCYAGTLISSPGKNMTIQSSSFDYTK